MARALDGVIELAQDSNEMTVILSPYSVAVILFLCGIALDYTIWLEGSEDYITDADISAINQLVANLENDVIGGVEE